MNNPISPYPGRQIFLGKTIDGAPCFSYLITGRSPESRQRKAVLIDDVIRIGPLGNQPYDALRHYNAVKFDRVSGVLSVSNGIQTDAGFELYKLLLNTSSVPKREYLEKVFEGAGAEPDSYHTPRIGGVITFHNHQPVYLMVIKTSGAQASAFEVNPSPGQLVGLSTYKGSVETPEATDSSAIMPTLDFKSRTAEELGKLIFDISAYTDKGNDIRVCSIGGIFSRQSGWSFYVFNVQT